MNTTVSLQSLWERCNLVDWRTVLLRIIPELAIAMICIASFGCSFYRKLRHTHLWVARLHRINMAIIFFGSLLSIFRTVLQKMFYLKASAYVTYSLNAQFIFLSMLEISIVIWGAIMIALRPSKEPVDLWLFGIGTDLTVTGLVSLIVYNFHYDAGIVESERPMNCRVYEVLGVVLFLSVFWIIGCFGCTKKKKMWCVRETGNRTKLLVQLRPLTNQTRYTTAVFSFFVCSLAVFHADQEWYHTIALVFLVVFLNVVFFFGTEIMKKRKTTSLATINSMPDPISAPDVTARRSMAMWDRRTSIPTRAMPRNPSLDRPISEENANIPSIGPLRALFVVHPFRSRRIEGEFNEIR